MYDGFTSYEGTAKRYVVHHTTGTTFVYANNETIALMRFMAKYPDKKVKEIKQA